jgi:8-oxo-dGTP diphosphatase
VRSTRGESPRALDAIWHRAYRAAFRLQRIYWWLFRPTISGSYVAVWFGDRILVIENSYRTRLSLPAGGLHRGETPIEGALRELREEVGIRASTESLHFVDVIVSHVGHAEDHAHFYELVCDEAPAIQVDQREVVWADFMLPAEALEVGVVDVVRQYLSRPGLPHAGQPPESER